MNNTAQAIDENAFIGLMSVAVELLEEEQSSGLVVPLLCQLHDFFFFGQDRPSEKRLLPFWLGERSESA